MTIETTLAVIAAGLTTIVTVVLFVVNARWSAKEARQAAQSRMVSQMLTTMSETISTMQRFPWARLGKTPDLTFTLAVPLLLVDVPKKDEAIFVWAMGQTQLMREASSNRRSLAIGVQLTLRIAEWHRGHRPTQWFQKELSTSPVATRPTPKLVRFKRWASQVGELAIAGVVVVVGVESVRAALRSSSE